jgi:deoxyribodipyrimidine photolyase
MTTGAAPKRIILWFRNDLRVRDNAIIHQAVRKLQSKEFDEVGSHCLMRHHAFSHTIEFKAKVAQQSA